MHCYRWRVCGWNTWRVSDRYEWTVSSEYALLHSLQRDGLKKGIVTLCIGGGQGIALALEML